LRQNIPTFFFSNEKKDFFIPFILGLIVELFSNVAFGIILLSIFITLLLLNWLMYNIFTHLSFYSILFFGIFGTVFYKIIYTFLVVLSNNYTLQINYNNILDLLYELGMSFLIILLMNIVYYFFKNKFKKKNLAYYE